MESQLVMCILRDIRWIQNVLGVGIFNTIKRDVPLYTWTEKRKIDKW